MFAFGLMASALFINQWARSGRAGTDDPDTYLRLMKAEQVYVTGDRAARTINKIGPPAGLRLHWTAPADFLLINGARFFPQDKGFRAALFEWSGWYPAVLFAAAGFCLALCGVYAGVTPAALFFVPAVAALRLLFWGVLVPGNADHHGLQAVLWLALVAAAFKIFKTEGRTGFAIAGVIIGLGIWVSVVFMVFAGLVCGSIALWCVYAKKPDCRFGAVWLSGCAAAVLGAAVLVEYPAGVRMGAVYDMVSTAHAALFAFIGLSAWVYGFFFWRLETARARFYAAAGMVLCVLAAEYLLFPGLFASPVRQYGGEAFYSIIRECRALVKLPAAIQLAFWFEFTAATAAAGFYSVKAAPVDRAAWRMMAALCVVCGALSCYEVRWLRYATPLFVIPLSALCASLMRWPGGRKTGEGRLIAAVALLAVIFSPAAVIFFTPASCSAEQALGSALRRGGIAAALGAKPVTVLVQAGFAPQLVYWTQHNALAGNYYQLVSERKQYEEFFDAASDEAAYRVVKSAGVEAVLFCAGARLLEQSQRFADALERGETPGWLVPVPGYGKNENGILFYTVRQMP